jgi:integrase
LVQRKKLQYNPISDVQSPHLPRQRKRHVTDAEFRQLYRSIAGDGWTDMRDRIMLLILYYSGLRTAELVSLRVEDVDRIHMVLHVNCAKGGKDRNVPFLPELLEHLDVYLATRPYGKHGYLFLARHGHQASRGPLTYYGLREVMRRRCVAAGMKRLGLHSFRHGYAMAFLNAGMDMSALAQSLGHASMETTRRFYAEWMTGDLTREYNNALRRLGPPPTLSVDS